MTLLRRSFSRTLLVLASLFVAAVAGSAVPGQTSYQGLLLDDLGDPVTATVAMEFELFDAPSGGSALWFESHPAVQVVDGVYDVVLGAITPIDQAVVQGGAIHLEVTVEGETLTPRTQLLMVPYALRAEVAENAGSLGLYDAAYFEGVIEHVNLDGQLPGNTDPEEGTGDTDGDGLPNFLDSDNDDDGVLDGDELSQGSAINLPTPTISGYDPPFAYGESATVVQVQGANFEPGMTVTFGAETPTPTNVTSTSFDVTVGPLTESTVPVTITRANGETVASSYYFRTERVIFVTASSSTGNMGGLAGADAMCQTSADNSGLFGTYQAWLSDGVDSPSTRASQLGGPYVDTTGTVIADDWADLTDGTLDAGIAKTASGSDTSGSVWSNVTASGANSAGSLHCLGWTSSNNGNAGRVGVIGATSSDWSNAPSGLTCGTPSIKLYCIEQ